MTQIDVVGREFKLTQLTETEEERMDQDDGYCAGMLLYLPTEVCVKVVNVLFCYNIMYKDVSYVQHFCEIESNYSGLL